jgi:hypothetical protein
VQFRYFPQFNAFLSSKLFIHSFCYRRGLLNCLIQSLPTIHILFVIPSSNVFVRKQQSDPHLFSGQHRVQCFTDGHILAMRLSLSLAQPPHCIISRRLLQGILCPKVAGVRVQGGLDSLIVPEVLEPILCVPLYCLLQPLFPICRFAPA